MNLSFTRRQTEPVSPPFHIILASQSIGRRTLLEKLGLRFRVVLAQVDEDKITDPDPLKMLRRRAEAKAREITTHPRVYNLAENAQSLVIAADSMGIYGKKTFGKARDRDEARRILKTLMGKTHTFATAININLLVDDKVKKTWEKVVKSRVTLRKLSTTELESYLARYDFSRFAAGYALNETPWDLVTKIEGSYTNVIGLPFEILLPVLRQLKIIL